MGHIFNVNLKWINYFINTSENIANDKWLLSASSKSSLTDYVLIKSKPYLENYLLCKVDLYGAALKFKANTLPLHVYILGNLMLILFVLFVIMMLMILDISYSYVAV